MSEFGIREEANMLRFIPGRMLPLLLLAVSVLTRTSHAQNSSNRSATLGEDRFKSGALTLAAFSSATDAARHSIVRIDLDGKTVALGTVVEASGLIITKASELKDGKLTCKLANHTEIDAELVARDDDNDVALVKVKATSLTPIRWVSEEASVGQWVVTPGTEKTPEAVGIVSVPPRKILPKRALIGVLLTNAAVAKIVEVTEGLGAEKAGLKPGDIILAVNDTKIKNRDELTTTLRHFREGQTVKLRVQRETEEFDASVRMMLPKPETGFRGFNRQERMNRLGGEISQRSEGFELAVQHDTVLQPWQCGGPLLNLDGQAIGLNIARAGRVASYALPAALLAHIIDDLKAQTRKTAPDQATEKTSPQVEPEPDK